MLNHAQQSKIKEYFLSGIIAENVKQSQIMSYLKGLEKDSFEVMWVVLRPSRLPRGYSNVIIAVVYHSPGANYESMRDCIQSSLEHIQSSFPNNAVIIAGDFNKLDLRATAKVFQLKPTVDFPKRGANIRDQIYMNLSEYYSPAIGAPLLILVYLTI